MRNVLIGTLTDQSRELLASVAHPAPESFLSDPVLWFTCPTDFVPAELEQNASDYSVTVRPILFRDIPNEETGKTFYSGCVQFVSEGGAFLTSDSFREILNITARVPFVPYFDLCDADIRSSVVRRWRLRTVNSLVQKELRFNLQCVDLDSHDHEARALVFNPRAEEFFRQ